MKIRTQLFILRPTDDLTQIMNFENVIYFISLLQFLLLFYEHVSPGRPPESIDWLFKWKKKEKESWSSKNSVVMDRIKNLMVYSKCFNYARILNLENLKQSALLKEVGTHENILQKEKEVERRKWKSNVIPPHRDNDWSIF